MDDGLSIGRIGRVFVTKPPTDAQHSWRDVFITEEPTSDIHLVDSLVAHVSVTRIEIPVPIVMQLRAKQFSLFRGAAPQVVINILRNR